MMEYEDTKAGATSKAKPRKMGTANGKNEHESSEKKNMVAKKMALIHPKSNKAGGMSYIGRVK